MIEEGGHQNIAFASLRCYDFFFLTCINFPFATKIFLPI
jgi:hypothetical protein